jgi:hypothetical protein
MSLRPSRGKAIRLASAEKAFKKLHPRSMKLPLQSFEIRWTGDASGIVAISTRPGHNFLLSYRMSTPSASGIRQLCRTDRQVRPDTPQLRRIIRAHLCARLLRGRAQR